MLEEIKQAQFNHCPKHPGNESDLLCIHADCKKYLMCSDCEHTPEHPICTIHDLVAALRKLINYEQYQKGPSLLEAEQNLEVSFQTIFMELKSLKQFFKTQYNYMKENLKHYIQEQSQTHGIYSFIKSYVQQSGSLSVQLKSNLVPNLHFEGSQCYLKCNTPHDSQKTSYDFLKIVAMLQAKTQQLGQLSRKIQSEYALQVENYRQKLSKSQTIVQDEGQKKGEKEKEREKEKEKRQGNSQETLKQEQEQPAQYFYYKKKTEEREREKESEHEIVIDIDEVEVAQRKVVKQKGRPRKDSARVKTKVDGGIVAEGKSLEGRQKKWISIFEGRVFYLDLLYPKQSNRQPTQNECLICKCNIRFPQYKSYNYQPLRYGDLCGPVPLNEHQHTQLVEGFNERKDKATIIPTKDGVYFHELYISYPTLPYQLRVLEQPHQGRRDDRPHRPRLLRPRRHPVAEEDLLPLQTHRPHHPLHRRRLRDHGPLPLLHLPQRDLPEARRTPQVRHPLSQALLRRQDQVAHPQRQGIRGRPQEEDQECMTLVPDILNFTVYTIYTHLHMIRHLPPLLLLSLALALSCDPVPLWLDLDTGNDDAFALLIAARSPAFNLLGVSTSYGNSNVHKTAANTVKLLSFLNVTHLPVIQGYTDPLHRQRIEATVRGEFVHGDSGMFGSEKLQEAFPKIEDPSLIYHHITQLAAQHGKLVITIFGSSTNIARLFMNHPDIHHYVKEVFFMGGAINFGNVTPCSEFNVYCDAHATSNLIQLANQYAIDVVMAPLEVTKHGHIEDWFIEEMKKKKSELGMWFSDLTEKFRDQCRSAGFDVNAIHDGIALTYFLYPELYPKNKWNVVVETESEICYGRTIVDQTFKTGRDPNVYVLSDMLDKSVFFRYILSLFD